MPRWLNRLTTGPATLITASLLTLLIAAPAHANTRAFTDRQRDAPRSIDILDAKVNNGDTKPTQVRVQVRFRNINLQGGNGYFLYLDTRPKHPGPEYRYVVGGSEYEFYRMRTWRNPITALPCRDKVRIHHTAHADTLAFVIPRSCLGDANRVRISARGATSSPYRQDWAPGFHRFYPWVAR
jgi:hypothetical protein